MRADRRASKTCLFLQAALLCAVASGCYTDSAAPPLPPLERKAIDYKRVGIVEFLDKSGRPGVAAQFSSLLRQKLAERTVDTDVVLIPRSAFPSLGDPFVGGTIPVDVLVTARRDYLAEALVFGCVDGHNPYAPPSVHVTLKVVDTANAAIPYEVSDGWDGGHQVVRDAIDVYYRRNIRSDDCRLGPNVFLVSPTYFLRFVAATVSDGLADAL